MWIYFSINDIINWKYNINSLKGDAMIKTVMFDLDDTVFDHKRSRLCALNALKNENKGICNIPLEDLEKEHEILLSGNYTKVLDKTLTMKKSMIERTYLLFKRYGITLSNDAAIKYTDIYKQAYENNRRATPKVKELIEILKQSVKVGIVSNGLFDIQVEKVKICQIEDIIDYMVFSEDVGARKPEKTIFETAMRKSNVKPEEAVFIGDSWESDIIGASNCGMKTIWLNRYKKNCPNSNLAYEIQSFDPIENILRYIFG